MPVYWLYVIVGDARGILDSYLSLWNRVSVFAERKTDDLARGGERSKGRKLLLALVRQGELSRRSAARRICLSIASRSVGGGAATFINETRILGGPRWLRSPEVGTSYFIEARLYFRAYDFNCRCGLRLYFFSSFTGARSTALSRKRQSPLKPGMPALARFLPQPSLLAIAFFFFFLLLLFFLFFFSFSPALFALPLPSSNRRLRRAPCELVRRFLSRWRSR